jgi:hypothetical protein
VCRKYGILELNALIEKYGLYIILGLITIACVPVAISGIYESTLIWKVRKCPIVSGKVLSREPIEVRTLKTSISPADQITIQIVGTETKVHAIMFQSASEKLPELVSFHFNGNIDDRVFLEGQEDPLWSSLIICGFLIFIWTLRFWWRILFTLVVWLTVLKRGHYP